MGDEELVFHAHGITKTYHMGEVDVHALRGVDLDLHEGELVVLLGPSGSGKSTLLNILGGLDVPELRSRALPRPRPDDRADEAELTDYRRHHVGFVFQFYNLIPSLTARENVALVTEIVGEPDGAGGGARARRPRRAARPLPGAALGRRAAARRDRARHRQAAGRAALRRADRRARHRDRHRRPRGPRARQPRARHDDRSSSPTTPRSRRMADRVVRLADGRIAGVETNAARRAPRELVW